MTGAQDTIVIGSGIGGLVAAAALARHGRRVLVLERHWQAGGLTQTFQRGDYTFATGVHYLGGVSGDDAPLGRLLHWLTGGALRFARLDSPYDIVRTPGVECPVEAPREAFVQRLKALFPGEARGIDAYFEAFEEARRAAHALFASRSLPGPVGAAMRALKSASIRRALSVTSAEAVRGIREQRLAAVLTARWGDYGVPPASAPLALHAMVLGSYLAGASYPVGGPARFAQTLGATITRAGGEIRTGAAVKEILVADGRAAGVRLASGETLAAATVISAMGARNTVAALAPQLAPQWREAVQALTPSLSYVTLYLGLRGDIRAAGATSANLWHYETHDVGRVWERPEHEDAPALFVCFPTLKDGSAAPANRHTAEIIAPARWEAFARWAGTLPGRRTPDYAALKSRVAERMFLHFGRLFPRVAALMQSVEVSTPLSQAWFARAHHGAMYGLEMSAARMTSDALRVQTPVPGLLLAGQDACSPGIPGALMGGFMAAASVAPSLWRKLHA